MKGLKKRLFLCSSLVILIVFCFLKVPVVQAYQYNIASISKIVTSMAVMQLVDEGKIDLDEKVTTYIPEFHMKDQRYKDITVRMLLNHSSGIMGSTQYHSSTLGRVETAFHDNLIEKLAKQTLKADPGSYSVYCNDGFSLLEILIERVSGMSFTKYIEKNIFSPLGMTSSLTPQSEKKPDDLVGTYINGMRLEDEICNALGDGGIISTTEDLVKLSTVYMKNGPQLLNEKSRISLLQSEVNKNTYSIQQGKGSYNYGLGWDTVSTYPFAQLGIKALSKGGDLISSHGNITVLPDENMSCAVLTTGGSSEIASTVANELLTLALEEKGVLDREKIEETEVKSKQENTIPESMKKYEGIYIGSKMYQVTFTDAHTLMVATCDQEIDREQEYIYQGNGIFQSVGNQFLTLNGAEITEGGKKGNTELSFQEMSDGNILLSVSSDITYNNLGKTALTLPLAQKVDEQDLNEKILDKWKKRDGMNYFIINDDYASEYLLNYPTLQIKLSKVDSNFVQNSAYLHVTKITDENNAKDILKIPGMVGRDLNDLSFSYNNGVELLTVSTTGGVYVPESSIEELVDTKISYETETDQAKWYKIGEKVGGKQVTFKVTDHAAVYVYNKYRSCIYTTLMKNQQTQILLPKEGYILFIGEDENAITME